VGVLRGPAGARFAARVNTAGPLPADESLGRCHVWTGALDDQGYGVLRGEDGPIGAHRFAYVAAHGEPDEGLVIDHVCHDPRSCIGGVGCAHRRCCNPAHLVAVERGVNALRGSLSSPTVANAAKTHCVRGHPLVGENVYRHPKRGSRHCRACMVLRRQMLRSV
jgi:hypothetical protein